MKLIRIMLCVLGASTFSLLAAGCGDAAGKTTSATKVQNTPTQPVTASGNSAKAPG